MKRPLFIITLLFIAGIIIAHYGNVPFLASFVIALVLAAAVGIVLLLKKYTLVLRGLVYAFIVSVAVVMAAAHRQTSSQNTVAMLPSEDNTFVRVKGVLAEEPVTVEYADPYELERPFVKTSFILKCEHILCDGQWKTLTGKARVTVYDRLEGFFPGDHLELVGYLSGFTGAANPGQFDYKHYMQRKNISARLFLKDTGAVLVHTSGGSSLVCFIAHIRSVLAGIINRQFNKSASPPSHVDAVTSDDGLAKPSGGGVQKSPAAEPSLASEILAAILIGKSDSVSGQTRGLFLKSGTFHFLVISGMHIAMLAFFLWVLLRLCHVSERTAAVILIVVVLLYMGITGFRIPVVRAGIIAVVISASKLVRRKVDTLNLLSLAALVILILKPTDLFDVGFQLSFAGVLGVMYVTGALKGTLTRQPQTPSSLWIGRALRKAASFEFLAIAAFLAVAPLVLYYFNFFTPISIVANVLVYPVMFLALIFGWMAILFGAIPLIGTMFVVIEKGILVFLTGALWLFGRVPFAYVYLPSINYVLLILYYAALVAFVISWRSRAVGGHKAGAFKRFVTSPRTYLACVGIVVILIGASYFTVKQSVPKIDILSVGQGASIYLEFPDGLTMLYDCGTTGWFDVASSTVAPFLWSKGITHLDCLVLSHPHLDHIKGVPSLLERISVGRAYLDTSFNLSDNGKKIIKILEDNGVPIVYTHGKTTLLEGDRYRVEAFARDVDEALPHNGYVDLNVLSSTLLVSVDAHTYLICQDNEGVFDDFPALKDIAYDAVVVPHHGFNSQDSLTFVNEVNTRCAVVSDSSSTENEEIIERLKARGITVLRTSRYGCITITPSDGKTDVRTFLKSREFSFE